MPPKSLIRLANVVPIPLPPRRPGTWIYFLTASDEVVYVGQTVDLNSRLGNHLSSGKDFDKAFAISLGDGVSQLVVDLIESAFIRSLRPKYNKTVSNGTALHDEDIVRALRNDGDPVEAVAKAIGGRRHGRRRTKG